MFRGNWNVGAALAGLALLFTVFGLGWYSGALNYPTDERYQPYRYAADKPLEVDMAMPGQASAQPFEYRAPCHLPKGREESDLCAQWEAANAAQNSALWTKWGFWIGVVGSSLLLWQISLTRKAVKDTSEATAAMLQANKIAADTAQRQLRAYVVVKNVRVFNFVPGQQPKISYEIMNVGQTPAYEVHHASQSFGGTSKEEMGTQKVHFLNEPSVMSRTTIGPGVPSTSLFELFDGPISQESFDAVVAGHLVLGLFGAVSYRDIYMRRRLITFKRFLNARHLVDGVGTFYSCERGNHAN